MKRKTAQAKTLIISGKGPSAEVARAACLERWPDAEQWTMNNSIHPGSVLHFDIHPDRRFWHLLEHPEMAATCVISPLLDSDNPRLVRYPLREVEGEFGRVYFECSACWLVALALLLHVRGSARWDRIALPGVDMQPCDDALPWNRDKNRHFAMRAGLHYWLGRAEGLGIDLVIPNGSVLLRRVPHVRGGRTDPEWPVVYALPPQPTLLDTAADLDRIAEGRRIAQPAALRVDNRALLDARSAFIRVRARVALCEDGRHFRPGEVFEASPTRARALSAFVEEVEP